MKMPILFSLLTRTGLAFLFCCTVAIWTANIAAAQTSNKQRTKPTPTQKFSIDLESDVSSLKPMGQFGNERNNKIFGLLARRVDIDCLEARFGDVMNEWSTKAEINVVLDESVIDNRLDEETQVTHKLSDVPFLSALRIVLREWDCDFVIKDEVLVIMSADNAKQQRNIMMYDCRQLVAGLQGDPEANYRKLVSTIQTVVEPSSWASNGGAGGISEVGGFLVVSTYTTNHSRVENFLQTLKKLNSTKQPN